MAKTVSESLLDTVERLKPLSGMAYHGYTKTADEWLALTGTDPRQFPGLVNISGGYCALTRYAKALLDNYFAQRRYHLAVLTGRVEW